MASARSGVLCVAVLGAVAALAGCPDPQGSFDEFGKRYNDIFGATSSAATTGAGGGCSAPMPAEIDGQFLFSLSAKLKPKKAIAFLMDVTTTDSGGQLMMAFKATPLSGTDHTTPVGAPIDIAPFPVNADGTFEASLGTITVSGDANPITPGSDIVATVNLQGQLCAEKPDFFCGTVTGQVMMPIMYDLAGSTFTLQRVMGALPFPQIDCAGTPAEY
ncbi:MAG: hypothetical protein U0414_11825 [Polyangiaceae bacterium]